MSQFYGLEPMPVAVLGAPAAVTDHVTSRARAIRRLQRQAGLEVTGEVNQETREVSIAFLQYFTCVKEMLIIAFNLMKKMHDN